MSKFGERLKELLRAADMKQDALAAQIGTSQGHISKLIHDKAEPTETQVDEICKALGLGGRWGLVGGTEFAHLDRGHGLVTVKGEPGITYLAYFASALTGLSEQSRDQVFQEASWVRSVCEEHRIFLYEPRKYTDPVDNAEIPAARVYATDRAQVSECDFLILYCRHTSFGAGQEIEIAAAAGTPIIALIPQGMKLSRMVLGCYAPLVQIEYDSRLVLETELRTAIPEVLNHRVARRIPISESGLGERVRTLRERLGLSRETVSHLVGTTAPAILELEQGSCQLQNPSVSALRRLAHVLKTSVGYLVDGVVPLPEQTDGVLGKSKANLQVYAKSADLPYTRMEELWQAYIDEHAMQRRMVAEARSEPLSVDDWGKRHKPVARRGTQSLFGGDGEEESW